MHPADETYTPGYSADSTRFMERRNADRDAGFFTPHLKAGMRLLDCGCGPGTITAGLARVVAPEQARGEARGEVVGLDRELSQLVVARRMASAADLAIRFQQGAVYDLPFAAGSFDAVFSHALFEHLARPAKALAEIRRVLSPGGVAGLRCPDCGGFLIHPMTPLLGSAIDLYKRLQNHNGGDVYAGRKLAGWMRDAGFVDVAASVSYETHDPQVVAEFLAQGLEAARADSLGVDPSLLRDMAAELRRWSGERDVLFAQSWCEAVGRPA